MCRWVRANRVEKCLFPGLWRTWTPLTSGHFTRGWSGGNGSHRWYPVFSAISAAEPRHPCLRHRHTSHSFINHYYSNTVTSARRYCAHASLLVGCVATHPSTRSGTSLWLLPHSSCLRAGRRTVANITVDGIPTFLSLSTIRFKIQWACRKLTGLDSSIVHNIDNWTIHLNKMCQSLDVQSLLRYVSISLRELFSITVVLCRCRSVDGR